MISARERGERAEGQRPEVGSGGVDALSHGEHSKMRDRFAEKPFTCEHANCHKRFANKFLLKKHQFIHTGLRPHTCPFCNKR